MNVLKLTSLVFALVLAPVALYAQDTPADEGEEPESHAPQILTSDLAPRQEIDAPSVQVSLVVVDDDNITAVSINGQRVAITPADTILLERTFQLNKQKTVISVKATDEAGNTRTKTYSVYKPGGMAAEDAGEEQVADEELKPVFGAAITVKYETDSNPTNDLSSGLINLDVTGVVDDAEQEDTRTTLQGTGTVTYGDWNGFIGFQDASYSKADNDSLAVQAILLGGGYTLKVSETFEMTFRGTFTDLNIGGNDYSQNIALIPALVFFSEDEEEGTSRDILRVTMTSKSFASSEQTDGSDLVFGWQVDSADPAKLDTFRNRLRYGSNTEGREQSDFTFLSEDADWQNRWEFGLRFDLGFGFAYRNYPDDTPLSTDTPLGTTRVDTLFRYSGGLGWQVNPDWSVMYNIRTINNLSNKSPYERTISGLVLQGAF